MRFAVTMVLAFLLCPVGGGAREPHPDYVPDERTAIRIAEAVLVARFGEQPVSVHLPLHASALANDSWLVQGSATRQPAGPGGNYGVWISKHSGCIQSVIERMK